MIRVAIGGISHETNTFSRTPTTLWQFRERTLLHGAALVNSSRRGDSTLGGLVDGALARDWQIVSTLFASATPGGTVRGGTFSTLVNNLVDTLDAAHRRQAIDGVLLSLHGAMVTDVVGDADGEILRRVRQALGTNIPIVVVFDSHANLTPTIVELADVILTYETYPHVDTRARGLQAVDILERILRQKVRPTRALHQIPMLLSLPAQWTGTAPMREIASIADRMRAIPQVLAVALASGFPYSDIPDAGVSVVVTTDNDAVLAQRLAAKLAEECWIRREQFAPILTPLDAAVNVAQRVMHGPIVLADVADNPGGGAAGDGTVLLDALLRAHVPGVAVAAIADPEVVAQAHAVGVGNVGRFQLGGKTDHLHGPTLAVDGHIAFCGEVSYINCGPIGTGMMSRIGPAAVLQIGNPETAVIVTERRTQVLDPELFRAVGIVPEDRRVLVVKSSVHFRAAFAPLAQQILAVDGEGLSSPDLRRLRYRRVRRPIWPLDDI